MGCCRRMVAMLVATCGAAAALVRPGQGPRRKTELRALRAPVAFAALRSSAELRFDAYEWCANYQAPAALVAGAVIASFYDMEKDDKMSLHKEDARWARVAKNGVKILLMSAFALEMLAVFVSTVTGTMLLSASGTVPATVTTPMGLLRTTFEFEYLACRICFLQGLVNWLSAIALQHAIPKVSDSASARRMNQFVSASLISLVLMMMSVYNANSEFNNYLQMLLRFVAIVATKFYGGWPPRLAPVLTVPALVVATALGVRALFAPPDDADHPAPPEPEASAS